MQVFATKIEDVKVIIPRRFSDDRGYFEETYNAKRYREIGIDCNFVQDNHSFSKDAGTIRGLHLQTEPFAQDKLIWCMRGGIWDVVVDLRNGSPTYGQYVSEELTPDTGKQLFIPAGFAHGFCTIKPDTEVVYKVSSLFSPKHETGVIWNDPDLDINWPIGEGDAKLSTKDQVLPLLKDLSRE